MAEVHIIDIDGEQWNIKDNSLTTRVETLEQSNIKNTADITSLQSESYVKNAKKITTSSVRQTWVTVKGLSPLDSRKTNVFCFSSGSGEYGFIGVGTGNEVNDITGYCHRFVSATSKLKRIILDGSDFCLLLDKSSDVRIQQINGESVQFTIAVITASPIGIEIPILQILTN